MPPKPPAPPMPTTEDEAVAFVQTYCGWHIAPELDETLTLDGPGSWALILPTLHVASITSITEDGVALAEDADFTWSEAGIVRRRSWAGDPEVWVPGWWSSEYRSIDVELVHGFAEWPPDLAAVIGTISDRRKANPIGLEQITVGPFSEKYASAGGALSTGELFVLDAYKLPKRV
jgi:hypothetical protein